jgi:hypothetical protein
MSYAFEFDPVIRLLKVSFEGDLDERTLVQASLKLRDVVPALKSAKGLSDFSLVTAVHIASERLHSLAQFKPAFPSDVPHAIVAPRDYIFGLARMFQAVGSETRPNLYVVRTEQEAYRLLGIADTPKYERLKVA